MTTDPEIRDLQTRVAKLERAVFGGASGRSDKHARPAARSASTANLDFSMPIRAFAKRHAKGLSGPKIFTLLVAYLNGGDSNKRVSVDDVKTNWNKLTSILRMKFNPAHASRARENDWVHTEKTGLYYLRPSWKGALG